LSATKKRKKKPLYYIRVHLNLRREKEKVSLYKGKREGKRDKVFAGHRRERRGDGSTSSSVGSRTEEKKERFDGLGGKRGEKEKKKETWNLSLFRMKRKRGRKGRGKYLVKCSTEKKIRLRCFVQIRRGGGREEEEGSLPNRISEARNKGKEEKRAGALHFPPI